MINLNEILAYKVQNKNLNYNNSKKLTKKSYSYCFNNLGNMLQKSHSPLLNELKVLIVLVLKWHFDYLAKTRSNPNELKNSVIYWIQIISIFRDFAEKGWIKNYSNKKNKKNDIWKITKKAFNFMWPKNTNKEKFLASKMLADLRMKQIVKMISSKKKFFQNKVILDSGCGPGRYIDVMLKHKPYKIIGIDSGNSIIKENKKKFKKFKNVKFIHSTIDKLKIESQSVDLLISAGVLHQTKTDMEKLIKEHARVIKKNGHFFVFIAGKGGMELELWKLCRKIMSTVDMNTPFNMMNNKISPMRLQGFLDHSYGEYKSTDRSQFEKMLKKNFSKIIKIHGIDGADVTPHTFSNDKYFNQRFGSGNLRYLCIK